MKAKLNLLICEVIEWFYSEVPLLFKCGFHLKSSKINSVEKPAEHIAVLQIPSPVWPGFTKHKTKMKLFYVKGKNSYLPHRWSLNRTPCLEFHWCHCSKLESIIDLKVISPPCHSCRPRKTQTCPLPKPQQCSNRSVRSTVHNGDVAS